jgi:hypothetical protein
MGSRPKRFDVAGMHSDEVCGALGELARTVEEIGRQAHGVVEVGGSDPMAPAARRWSGFLEEWARYDSGNVAGFAEIDGIDFSQVPKGRQSRSRSNECE